MVNGAIHLAQDWDVANSVGRLLGLGEPRLDWRADFSKVNLTRLTVAQVRAVADWLAGTWFSNSDDEAFFQFLKDIVDGLDESDVAKLLGFMASSPSIWEGRYDKDNWGQLRGPTPALSRLVLPALTVRAPQHLATVMLDELCALSVVKNHHEPWLLRAWFRVMMRHPVTPLDAALDAGLALAASEYEARILVGLAKDDDARSLVPLGTGESAGFRALALGRVAAKESDPRVTASLLSDLDRLFRDSPVEAMEALPWELAAKKTERWSREEDIVAGTARLYSLVDQRVRRELDRLRSRNIPGLLGRRIDGFCLECEDSGTSDLGNAVSWWSDTRNRRSPTPLVAPAATWLENQPLETALRDACRCAAARMADTESLYEEHLTGSLLAELRSQLNMEAKTLAGTAPALRIDYQTTTKAQEKQHGPDLAIILNVNVARIRTSRVHFVQIKTAKHSTVGDPRWNIPTDQLHSLTATDPSATYWLLCDKPEARVLCLPAAVIQGLAAAKGREGARSVTLTYRDVRSAAIDLGSLMCDLVIGLWLGMSRQSDVASFLDERSSLTPARIMAITVGEWAEWQSLPQ
jgi:hypothetical protein